MLLGAFCPCGNGNPFVLNGFFAPHSVVRRRPRFPDFNLSVAAASLDCYFCGLLSRDEGTLTKRRNAMKKNATYTKPELKELGKAAKLTLGSTGGAPDACNCAKGKPKAA